MKRLISLILILTILSQSFLFALKAQAAVESSAVSFAGCATGNIGGTLLATEAAKIVSKLKNKAVDTLSNVTKVPVFDSSTKGAQDSGNIQYITKEYITDVIARCAARTILSAMVGNIFNIMRTSGRDGGITFIKNWANFQTQAQYRGENIFRAQLSTAKLCDYLSSDIKKAFGVDPKKKTPIAKQNTRTDSLQSFGLATKCTMPSDFTLEKYQNDFVGNGGWDAYARMLEPQNNIWGLMALSNDEIAKQRTLAVSADTNQALAGDGYLGSSGRGASASCAVKSPVGSGCIVYNDIKTTGSYIAANVAAGISAELTWLTSAQSLGSIIGNLTEVLLNRLLDQGNPNEGKVRVADEFGGVNIDTNYPPSPPNSEEVCLTNEDQRDSIKSIFSEALTQVDRLGVDDFEKTSILIIRLGQTKINDVTGQLTNLYSKLFELEKTIPVTGNGELKQLLQSYEDTVKLIIERISDNNFAWRDDLERVSIERELIGITKSVQDMITLLNSIGICGQTPPGGGTTPPGTEPESLLSDVQAEREKYGTPMTKEELGKLLNAVAWKNRAGGWVLLGKASGANCPMPNGVPISCDILVHQPTVSGFDVFIDGGGATIPTWDGPDPYIPGFIQSGERTFVAPTQP